ncbi:Aste57867_24948 [Aphanomyces stellatus]|uniref:Aste57867_24948 protein n=1 Tax=Aphanomyces stellatus TaxID=120398 RepID=A0A485LSE7_9STRA|nr:hypothetical protein As57867_024870 [Aphanomyces stellatus]VFU01579.1 Aste57867_24948 [Aphanomyces stellatus]
MDSLVNARLPPHAGVRCALHPIFGASLYTTRAFEVGETVWHEDEAALVSPGTSLLAYASVLKAQASDAALAETLSAFMTLDEATVDADPTFATIAQLCQAFRKSHGAARMALVTQLVSAFEINGHGLPDDRAGLFVVASKAAHSCSPNVIYTPRGPRGMAYVAIKPIAADALVYYSYIAREKLGFPTHFRQALLRQSYYFVCGCARCDGDDHVRPLPCPACETGEMLHRQDAWTCRDCGLQLSDDDAPARLPLELEERLDAKVMGFEVDPGSAAVTNVRAAFKDATAAFSPNHWATIYLARILAEMSMPPSTEFMAPALTPPQLHATTKRIATWCRDVLAPHNPVSAASLVFAYRAPLFAQCARGDVDAHALLAYFYPFFRLNFGPNDADVVEWRGYVWGADVQEREGRLCAECTRPASQRCGRCASVAYCSKACQVANWKTHKPVCPTMASQRK